MVAIELTGNILSFTRDNNSIIRRSLGTVGYNVSPLQLSFSDNGASREFLNAPFANGITFNGEEVTFDNERELLAPLFRKGGVNPPTPYLESDDWMAIELPSQLLEVSTLSVFVASTGFVYISGLSRGMWCLDRKAKTITFVSRHLTGEFTWFHETSDGTVWARSAGNIVCFDGHDMTVVLASSVFTTVHVISNENIYVGANATNGGMWHINTNTRVATRITTPEGAMMGGAFWPQLREFPNGDIYAASTSGVPAFIKLEGTTGIAMNLGGTNGVLNMFEHNGEIFLNFQGLNRVNGRIVEPLLSGTGWGSTPERRLTADDGYTYMTGAVANSGIIRYKDSVAEQLLTTGNFANLTQTKNGDIYAWGGTTGVVHIKDNIATQVWAGTQNWNQIFETSKGHVYLISSVTANSGVLYLDSDNSAQQIFNIDQWNRIFEAADGSVYVSGSRVAQVGILFLDGNQCTRITTAGYSWVFVETGEGEVFATSSAPTTSGGVFRLNGTTALRLVSSSHGQLGSVHHPLNGEGLYWLPTSAHVVVPGPGIWFLRGNSATTIFPTGQYNSVQEINGKQYAIGHSRDAGIVELDGNIATQVAVGRYISLFEHGNKVYSTNSQELAPSFNRDMEESEYRQSGLQVNNYTVSLTGQWIELKDDFPKKRFLPTTQLANLNVLSNGGTYVLLSPRMIIFNTNNNTSSNIMGFAMARFSIAEDKFPNFGIFDFGEDKAEYYEEVDEIME